VLRDGDGVCHLRIESMVGTAPDTGAQSRQPPGAFVHPYEDPDQPTETTSMNLAINPLIALGVLASTAATDAAYVFFNAAVSSRRRLWAANWSSIWYMLSAFAVISYTENWIYVAFAALGSWLGAFASVTWLHRGGSLEPQRHDPP
jgi:hypothetical protein